MRRTNPSVNSLAPGIAALATAEGCNATRYPGAAVYRVTAPAAPSPTLYPASLIFVGAGEKHGILGNETFAYNASHYLFVGSPVPMLCRTLASPSAPLLSLVVNIEIEQVRELLLDLDELSPQESIGHPRTVFQAPLDTNVENTAARLLRHLASDRATQALARSTVKELLFLVLEGPYRDSLRALAQGPLSRLGGVLRHMSKRYADRVSIAELARLAHMSVPTFHQHFRAVTATSPLQYMKTLRLTRAQQLLRSGSPVKTVARDVGYKSESQFSRDFRRYFGAPPSSTLSGRLLQRFDGVGA